MLVLTPCAFPLRLVVFLCPSLPRNTMARLLASCSSSTPRPRPPPVPALPVLIALHCTSSKPPGSIQPSALSPFAHVSAPLPAPTGDSWAHAATSRVILFWSGDQRYAHLHKCPSMPSATVPFYVTSEGIRGRPEPPPWGGPEGGAYWAHGGAGEAVGRHWHQEPHSQGVELPAEQAGEGDRGEKDGAPWCKRSRGNSGC